MRYDNNKLTENECIVYWMQLTVEKARKLLESNDKNFRRLDPGRARRYARAIEDDFWTPRSGAVILIDSDGRMVDGQTRCQAVILAGKAITTLVIEGVDHLDEQNPDSGKPRSVSAYLHYRGYKNSHGLAASLRWLAIAEMGNLSLDKSAGQVDVGTALQILERHPALPEFVTMSLRANSASVTASILAAVGYWCGREVGLSNQQSLAAFGEFVEGISKRTRNGEPLGSKSPPIQLRDRCMKIKLSNASLTPKHMAALVIKSYSAHLLHKEIGTLRWNPQHEFPQFITKGDFEAWN